MPAPAGSQLGILTAKFTPPRPQPSRQSPPPHPYPPPPPIPHPQFTGPLPKSEQAATPALDLYAGTPAEVHALKKKSRKKIPAWFPTGSPSPSAASNPPSSPPVSEHTAVRCATPSSPTTLPLCPHPSPAVRSPLLSIINQVPDRLPLSTNADQYAPSPDATSLSATSACALAFPSTPLEKPLRRDRLPGFTQAVTRPSTLKTPPPTRYTPRASSSLTAPLRRTGRDSPEFAI